ncbi:hypothetical protein Agub_g908 [Astrephomene gubernaculifera]|uniref:Protein kinase domain-containing protein n=1 Tax=Astrephomene gubernaculifera TaxID=47775 RepID=A0AAD3DEH9_9CHLO|nr:hypothetical protein Agub_g908 [Astrephomene gubernaculifera]
MGLSTSCLRGPKNVEHKETTGDEGFVPPPALPDRFGGALPVANAAICLSGSAFDVPVTKLAGNGDVVHATPFVVPLLPHNHGSAKVSSCEANGDCISDASEACCFPVHSSSTEVLSSVFTSTQGYPHSLELGPPSSDDEQSRVQALRALDVLDSVAHGRRSRLDEEADLILGNVMSMFRANTAMLVFFEDSRIVIRNAKGLIGPGEFPYRWSFCAYTLTKQRPQTLLIPDATKDVRFAENPFVQGAPHVRFYCGAPLVSSSGHILGTLCFADSAPRPGFDAGQCTLINNMAELMVRQLERYKANAGPAGQNDAETTALARVARTIDCYEAITGLVDVSLPDGWMLMYANEAWEQCCAPLSRKQIVGRPLQRFVALEPEPFTLMDAVAGSDRPRRGDVVAQSLVADDCEEQPQQHLQQQQHITTSGGGGGSGGVARAGQQGAALGAMPGVARRDGRQRVEQQSAAAREPWERSSAALRSGAEVDMGLVRLLLEDGRPTNTVLRMHVRSANCHVLDAATRMPVGVPPQAALPTSILASATSFTTAASAAHGPSRLGPSITAAGGAAGGDGTATTAICLDIAGGDSSGANANVEGNGGCGGDASTAAAAAVEPFYCFVTLTPVSDADDTAEQECEDGDAYDTEPSALYQYQRVTPLFSPHGAAAKPSGSRAAFLGGSGVGAPGTPPLSSRLSLDSAARAAARGSGAGTATVEASSRSYATAPGQRLTQQQQPAPHGAPACRPSPSLQNCGGGGWTGSNSSKALLKASQAGVTSRAPSNSGGLVVLGRPGNNSMVTGTGSLAGSALLSYRRTGGAGGGTNGISSPASRRMLTGAGAEFGSGWVYGMEPFQGLRLGHLLGKGGYGRVFAASYKGQRVAAKVVSNSMLRTARCVNGVTLEALLAQELEHPYIVRTYKCVVRSYDDVNNGNIGLGGPFSTASRGASQLGVLSTTALSTAARGGTTAAPRVQSFGASGLGGSVLLPPGTPSEMSVLPCGPSDGAASAMQQLPTSPYTTGPCGVDVGGNSGAVSKLNSTAANTGTGAAIAGVPSGACSAAANVAREHGGEGAASATAGAAGQGHDESDDEDFDSFDAGGEEIGGMIDQLAAEPAHSIPTDYRASQQQQSAVSTTSWALRAALVAGVAGANGSTAGGTPYRPSFDASSAAAVSAATAGGGVSTADVFGAAAAAAAAAAAGSATAPQRGCEGEALPEGETWILQEFCTGGTLQDAIDAGRLRTEPSRVRGQPNMPAILLTATEVATAMHCLHSRGYMHGDLSAVNVLLTEAPAAAGGGGAEGGGAGVQLSRGWVAKVSDFGLAKHLPDPTKPYISSTYGVITHCAPETLKHYTQTQKSDSYSFGVLLWQMFTGSRPWANMNRFQILGAVTNDNSTGLRFLPSQQPPPRYRDLTERCLSRDPAERPSFAEVCEELRLMTLEAASAALKQGSG